MKRELGVWERSGSENYWSRSLHDGHGCWVISSVDSCGWSVADARGVATRARITGPETGDAGKAAADGAALRVGWTLEGGPVDTPAEPARRWGMTDAEQLARIEEAIAGIGDPTSSPAERVTEIVATLGRLGAERQRSTPARVADLERAIVALAVRMGER